MSLFIILKTAFLATSVYIFLCGKFRPIIITEIKGITFHITKYEWLETKLKVGNRTTY